MRHPCPSMRDTLENEGTATRKEINRGNGRGGEIRTHDLLYPKQARYRATLRPEPRRVKVTVALGKSNDEFLKDEFSDLPGS